MENLKLYSTGCPRCKILKEKLDLAGFNYVEENDKDKILEAGFTQVPVLEVNGTFYNYLDAVKFINSHNGGSK